MPASARERLVRALLVLGSVAFTTAALEGAARVARHFRGAGYEAAETTRYMEYDPLLGWRKRPNVRVTYRRREYTVDVAINRLGLRDLDRGYEAPAGCLRILALGDSFVEGYTVAFPQTVGQVLESSIRAGGRAVEVLNAGTSGYSTDQEYLFYRTEGVRYSARIVLVFFYYNDVLYNDRDRFAKQPKPLLADRAGRLAVANEPVPEAPPAGPERKPSPPKGSALLEWLRDRLLYGEPRARQALARLGLWDPIPTTRAPLEIRVYERRPPPEIEAAWRKTALLLGALAEETAARGARLLVVYVPNRLEVDPRTWELTRILYGVDDTVWDRAAVRRRLERIGAERGFPVLDLTPALRARVHWPWSGPYFDYDGHWNAAGHHAAADAVRGFLEQAGWLAAG
ncbi:MAG: hypothetical protein DMF80_12970 [Acidobacteria bacterium]|nr:MAG: hypothetical protein DMF80_12970 [Acidobacteriota bacterium]